jgi:hypothetical protein
MRETLALEEAEHVVPSNRVKGFSNVKLEVEIRYIGFVESSRKVLYIKDVIMNASLLNKCTLCIGDKVIHVGTKASGKHLGNNLCNGVNETYGVEVGYPLRPSFLGKSAMFAEFNQWKLSE